MKFDRISIVDYGILRNQILEGLSSEINIIGGYNRAGKTTFKNLIKSFGYGIKKGEDIPPANEEYRASADINHQGSKYIISLTGYGNPKLIGDKREIESIYSVDYYTYSRLFSIDLDELKKVSKDEEKLAYVLLGGGYKEIAKIPKMIQSISKEGDKIGGKNGNPKSKEFKPIYEKIKVELSNIEEAKNKVKEYEEKKESLKRLTSREKEIISSINEEDDKLYLLQILKANYGVYKGIIDIEEKIKEYNLILEGFNGDLTIDGEKIKKEYMESLKSIEDKEKQYKNLFGNDIQIRDKLLSKKEEITNSNMNISGIKNKVDNLRKLSEEIHRKEEEVNKEIIGLNISLLDNKKEILEIKGDSISLDNIEEITRNYELLIREMEVNQNIIIETETNINTYEKLLNQYISTKDDKTYIKYMMMNALTIFIGSIVFIYNKTFGSLIGVSGLIGTLLYMYRNTNNIKEKNDNYKEINEKLELNKNKREYLIKSQNKDKESINYYGYKIDEIKRILKMSKESNVSSIKTYYIRINEIIKNLYGIDSMKENEKKIKKEISEILDSLYKLVGYIQGVNLQGDINNIEYIFREIEKLANNIPLCENHKYSMENNKNLQNFIKEEFNLGENDDLLESIDNYIENKNRYESLLNNIKNKGLKEEVLKKSMENNRLKKIFGEEDFEFYLEKFKNLGEGEELDKSIDEIEGNLRRYNGELNDSKREIIKLNYRIEELNSFSKIEDASIKLVSHKEEFYNVGEKYGSFRAANFILNNIQKNFMLDTKENLLNGGSRVFEKLTSGEYKNIEIGENILSSDFMVEKKDGDLIKSSDYLSRGTKEQLFLSVRISRIEEIKEKLPIIIDDSFVNFDMKTLESTVNIINSLSERNQIFIMTCHKSLVNLIAKVNKNASYFKLEEGNFQKTDSFELGKYLGGRDFQ